MNILLLIQILLFFQDQMTSTDEGVEYTPYEGFNWLLIVVGVITVGVVALVVVRVFKGIQRSRNLERIAEDTNSGHTEEKSQ